MFANLKIIFSIKTTLNTFKTVNMKQDKPVKWQHNKDFFSKPHCFKLSSFTYNKMNFYTQIKTKVETIYKFTISIHVFPVGSRVKTVIVT